MGIEEIWSHQAEAFQSGMVEPCGRQTSFPCCEIHLFLSHNYFVSFANIVNLYITINKDDSEMSGHQQCHLEKNQNYFQKTLRWTSEPPKWVCYCALFPVVLHRCALDLHWSFCLYPHYSLFTTFLLPLR